MRRYGVARYLSQEQRERAASAEYTLVPISNGCERFDACWGKGDYIPAARSVTTVDGREQCRCPLEVALDVTSCLDAFDFEARMAKSWDGSNVGARKAAQIFIHDVDSGKIAPDQVAAALGVDRARLARASGGGE